MPYANLFTTKQQRDIMNALKMGRGLHIYPSKKQSGGFLGTLLASIGIPMAIDLVNKYDKRQTSTKDGFTANK